MAKKKKSTPSLPAWIKHLWWLIPLLAISVYLPSFNAGFTLDDVLIVEENTYVKSTDKLGAIWTSHYWAGKMDATDTGLYRPLTLTTYNLQYAITGKNPMPFHVLNILLHALVCFVLMRFIKLINGDLRLVFLGGLLFAVHPIHTEAVSGIVGRAEILAALFILTSMISYHHWRMQGKTKWLVLLLLSTFAAVTSKEHGFLIPAILGLQEVYYSFSTKKHVWNNTKTWTAFGATILLCIGMWTFRSTITGPAVGHELWADVSATDRMATSLRTTMEYVGMHVYPMNLSADYWKNEVPVVGFGNGMVLLAIIFIGILVAGSFLLRRKLPLAGWGLLFFFLTLLPVSNFLFAAGFIKAERILYIPSIGLITIMAVLLLKMADHKQWKLSGYILTGIFVVFFSVRTYARAGDWKSNYTLALATLKTSPDSPRFNNMMGLELRALKQNDEALLHFEKAVASNPSHVPALVNLGVEYRNFGRHADAADILERALALDPGILATYVNLMSVYRSLNDLDKNLKVAQKAVARYPLSAPIMWNAANAYHLKGDMEKANELRAKAKAIDPKIGGD